MTHLFRPTLSLSAALLLLATTAPAHAGPPPMPEQRQPGMRHMQVAPPPQATPAVPAPDVYPPSSIPPPGPPLLSEDDKKKAAFAALYEARKPLTPAEAVVKPDDLKTWSHLADVVVLSTPESVDKMVKLVEADAGAVPPQALLFLAKGLAEQTRFEEAALYYYVAQLRISFDVTRWPARLDPEQIKQIQAELKKSPDQKSPQPLPKLKNPHESIALLAASIGTPIAQWMLRDPNRADAVMAKVKVWDVSTPYAYLPGYELPPATPYEDWVKALPAVRDGYFARMNQFIAGLKKIKAQ